MRVVKWDWDDGLEGALGAGESAPCRRVMFVEICSTRDGCRRVRSGRDKVVEDLKDFLCARQTTEEARG